MPEVYVKFDSLEEAMKALQGSAALGLPQTTAPIPAAPQYTPPAPAPAPVYQAPAPAPTPAYAPPAPAPMPAPAPVAAGGQITSAQVAAQAQAYAKVHGPKAAKAVFAEFGAGAVAQIDASHYPAIMQRMAV